MILTVEIPDQALMKAPVGQVRFLMAQYVRGVARQLEDNLSRGKVAVGVEESLAAWELIDPADECEGVAR